jgi:hypothetical protein
MSGASHAAMKWRLRPKMQRNVSNELHRDGQLLLLRLCRQHLPGALHCSPFLMRWKGRKRSFSGTGDPASRM